MPTTPTTMTPLETMRRCHEGEFAVSSANPRYAKSLLDACCYWTGQQGGTIHQFLGRLKWEYYRRENNCPVWHLTLDGVQIGWASAKKSELPAIEPSLMPGYLDMLYESIEIFV